MRKRKTRQVVSVFLTAAMTISIVGCGSVDVNREEDETETLNAEIVANADELSKTSEVPKEDQNIYTADAEAAACAITDFGLRLLELGMEDENVVFPAYASLSDENVLISPLSILSALTMTANGARGETLEQMEEVFGMPVSELSSYLADYRETLPAGDKYKLSMANAIWFTADEHFTVEEDFLQRNRELFQADVYPVHFDDSALQEINDWVKDNTDGMIPEILDEISDDAVMYLVNALAFDARWQEQYFEYQVHEGEFNGADGIVTKVQMMRSSERHYLEDEHATGFLKYYADEKYAFAALLPEEGMTVAEYAASLTGERLREILTHPADAHVNASIPQFGCEYGVEMKELLEKMGINEAFNPEKADFSGLGSSTVGNIYISRVLHKTFLAVDENGTKAGAATAVEMSAEGAMEAELVKEVNLDRPFLYLIIDCRDRLPLFIGTVETPKAP